MKIRVCITLLALCAILVVSCNKTKINIKRLNGETWKVTELSVDGINEAELPTLKFADCDAYKEFCKGEWSSEEGGVAEFAWQFRDKGKTFEVSNQSHQFNSHADEEAVMQCQNFSGVYDVKEDKKKSMIVESLSTFGFAGKKVVLKLEKQ